MEINHRWIKSYLYEGFHDSPLKLTGDAYQALFGLIPEAEIKENHRKGQSDRIFFHREKPLKDIILDLISEKPLSVADIADQVNASKHGIRFALKELEHIPGVVKFPRPNKYGFLWYYQKGERH